MVAKLNDYFERAQHFGGLPAKRRLAVLTGITSLQAATEDLTPELVERFGNALHQVELEYRRSSRETLFNELLRAPQRGQALVDALRRQSRLLVDFLSQRTLFWQDFDATTRRVTEAVSHGLDVARVSVWMFDAPTDSIVCRDLFDEHEGRHQRGTRLVRSDYPAYFAALRQEQTLSAPDAVHDPRTFEFAQSYLLPLGITSLLDVPIWSGDDLVGIVCCEHRGQMRTWTSDEEHFAYTLAEILGIAFEQTHH